MSTICTRRVATLVLGVFAFIQTSIAFSGCAIDRGSTGWVVAGGEQPVGDCDMPAPSPKPKQSANLCSVHCASGLQAVGGPFVMVRSATDRPVLAVVGLEPVPAPRTGLFFAPPGAPPRRILLHSFLI